MASTEGKTATWRDHRVVKEATAFGNRMKSFHASVGKSAVGQGMYRGAGMSLGWSYAESGTSEGFLGWNATHVGKSGRRAIKQYGQLRGGGAGRLSAAKSTTSTWARRSMSSMRSAGTMGTIKGVGSQLGGMAMKGIPLAFTLYGMYEGYQQEGVWGAIKGGAENVAMTAGWEIAGAMLGGATMPLAVMAAAGYAGYAYADAARDYGKQLKRVDMGAPLVDMFGTVATTRQRSLQALQNTHINGRMGLGNEGMLIHNNIYSRR